MSLHYIFVYIIENSELCAESDDEGGFRDVSRSGGRHFRDNQGIVFLITAFILQVCDLKIQDNNLIRFGREHVNPI